MSFPGLVNRTLDFLVAAVFVLAAATAPALADELVIESITVKFRDSASGSGASPLPAASRAALDDALQLPFVQVGGTRDGAFRLKLTKPIPLDQARVAVNRVRMLPQVLYANISDGKMAAAVADITTTKAAVVQGPPVRRMIVKYRAPAISQAAERNERLPASLLDRLSALAGQAVAHEHAMSGGAYVIRLFQAIPVDQAASLARYLETDPAIEYAEPDLLKQPTLTPNDPYYSLQWHYQSPPVEMGGVNLSPAWSITTGSTGIVVGVIDTGILPHPDLVGRYLGSYDMIADPLVANDQDPPSCTTPGTCSSRDANPTDSGDWITSAENASGYFQGCGVSNSSFHGTHVAGTIGGASNNGTGVAGINWVSKILPVRVLGKCGGYTSDIADAIVWATGGTVPGVPANPNPARVLNMSFGGSGVCGATSQNAINAALAAGAVPVVAAGNSNADASNFSPANCNGVITVGATGRQGQRASYSNYGAILEISAPGGSDGQGVLSTLNSGATSPDPAGYEYVYYQGTSMATPHVAGIASLMLSVNPSLTPAQVLAKIQSTARAFPSGTIRDCTTSLCGAGIIDGTAAVQAAAGAAPTPTTTSLASSANPAPPGATVTFTATVTGTNPSASVNFTDGGTPISGCGAVALSGSGNVRTAACSTANLSAGTHSIVAHYSGDGSNTASDSAPLSQSITVTGTVALPNAGFETPVLSANGYQYNPTGGTWVFNGGSGIQRNGSAWGAATAPEGQQTAFLQGANAQIAQTINLAAGSYSVSFYAARRAYQGAAQPLQLTVDGVAVGSPIAPVDTNFALYTSAAFSVSAGNHTLQFNSTNPDGDNSSFIDAVVLNVLSSTQAPAITSANAATFTVGQAGSFTVQATGAPTPTLSESGILPSGVTFIDNGNGTATLSGTPAASSGGSYTLVLTAHNGVGSDATQNFTLTVNPVTGTIALANAGFETPVLSANGYQYNPTGGTWVFNGGSGIQRNGSAWGAATAPEGQQTAFLQSGNAQIAQTINLAAGSYSVSFYAARRAYQGAAQPLQLTVDGVAVGSPIAPADTNFALYTSDTFSVSAGNHTLQFNSTNPDGDNSSFIDAVVLNVLSTK